MRVRQNNWPSWKSMTESPCPSTDTPVTLAQALRGGQAAGLERLDAQLLLLHAVGQDARDRSWLLIHDADLLTTEQHALWQQLVRRRLAGEPVAYLRGFHAFYGLQFAVDARVLDPRPDTETLVDWALELLPTLADQPCIADLGTGSGAIACAIAANAPHARVHACDASDGALAVARSNAERLQLPVQFAHGSWLQAFGPQAPRFDLIVSNPPYIPDDDPHLAALVHEPLSALASGADGLDDIRAIIAQAPTFLKPGGWLLLEHGHDQSVAVQALLRDQGFTQVQSRNDLAGIARCTGGQWA